eukprot:CAMPEP_0172363126 /NCGR_PEP_ID=MMETSP1060-20121228/6567_1 /TAXON_ID=37318 /ORGANISM="Pseudo-nitzschia pungens, Strain cf. cingulata" /LENGTH=349 /DNA_ID=CAMNT_0013085795 /DNA_START=203 /DNA_END=1252 /DNA_ORIENTATION=-
MILKSIAVAALVATTAVAAESDSSSPLLRGNNNKNNKNNKRGLQIEEQLLLAPAMGELRCEEHVPYDGSIVCTFRTTLPKDDYEQRNTISDCLRSPTFDTNYCVTTEIFHSTYFDANPETLPESEPQPKPPEEQEQPPQVDTVPLPNPLPEPMPLPEIFLREDGCPQQVQVTDGACWLYNPKTRVEGENEFSCYYQEFNLMCNCALVADPSIKEVWDCSKIDPQQLQEQQEQQEEQQQQQPAPPLVIPETEVVRIPVTNVDADIQSAVIPSPPVNDDPPEIFYPQFINQPFCPETQAQIEGTACLPHQRCMYWVEEKGFKLYANSCDCNWKNTDTFVCLRSLDPRFNPP